MRHKSAFMLRARRTVRGIRRRRLRYVSPAIRRFLLRARQATVYRGERKAQ